MERGSKNQTKLILTPPPPPVDRRIKKGKGEKGEMRCLVYSTPPPPTLECIKGAHAYAHFSGKGLFWGCSLEKISQEKARKSFFFPMLTKTQNRGISLSPRALLVMGNEYIGTPWLYGSAEGPNTYNLPLIMTSNEQKMPFWYTNFQNRFAPLLWTPPPPPPRWDILATPLTFINTYVMVWSWRSYTHLSLTSGSLWECRAS